MSWRNVRDVIWSFFSSFSFFLIIHIISLRYGTYLFMNACQWFSFFSCIFKNHNCFFLLPILFRNDQTHCVVILCEILELKVCHWWEIWKNWVHQSISWGQNIFEFKNIYFFCTEVWFIRLSISNLKEYLLFSTILKQ